MARLVTFIRGAKQTLDFAIYDMRFSDSLCAHLAAALREKAEGGVKIRFCYDADKPPQPDLAAGQDPAPSGTGAFVQSLGYPWRRIAGMKLMHSKYIVRDRQSVWTGSTNMTTTPLSRRKTISSRSTRHCSQATTHKILRNYGKRKISSTLAIFIPSLCRLSFPANWPRRESCFRPAAVWQSIGRSQDAHAQRNGAFASVVY